MYLTEKEENFRWNDITNQELAEKVRSSIQEVDQVLNLKDFKDVSRSVSTNARAFSNLPELLNDES
jgi:hypothetical protein